MLKHTKRYIGFSEGNQRNYYKSSGGTYDSLSTAKQRTSAVATKDLEIIEYELVPTGVSYKKIEGKWVEFKE